MSVRRLTGTERGRKVMNASSDWPRNRLLLAVPSRNLKRLMPELEQIRCLLANFGKEGRPEPLIAKISQETLAEMIGTTRSRVSFFMNKFRQLGLIDYNGEIEVHSSLLNVVLHDQPQIKT